MPECHSTNSFALQLCQQAQSAPEGTVVITDNQIAGRGQRGNVWSSEPGKNFTLSIVLKPTFLAATDQFYLNIFSSLSIYDYLTHNSCPAVKIKWPNDIYADGKKICGILIENQISGDRFTNVILGIGLNINQRQFQPDSATSLSLMIDCSLELDQELEYLLACVEQRYLQLRQNKYAALMENYLSLMHWIGERRQFNANGDTFEGIIIGVDQSGRLKMKIGEKEALFAAKEIAFVA